MNRALRGAPVLLFMLCALAVHPESEPKLQDNRIQLRLEGSSVYAETAAVPLTSVLLKKQITQHGDGSGTLAAVIYLTNRPGFGCQTDPDTPLASEKEFLVGIALYEPFAAAEAPEQTVLHQMLFSGQASFAADHPVTSRWQSEAVVLFRLGVGDSQWQSLKKGRSEDSLTVSQEDGKTVLTFDYADPASEVKGRVLPARCP